MSNNLFENWDQTKGALLDGLSGGKRDTVSQLLENQKNYLISESASAGSTEANNIANLRKTLIPMIRRVIPGTIATELVGVQAMSGPAAQVFTLRHQYEEDATAPQHVIDSEFGDSTATAQGQEVFGNTPGLRRFYSGHSADVLAGGSGLGSAGQVGTGDIAAANAGHAAGSDTTVSQETGLDSAASTLIPGIDGFSGNHRGGSGSYLEGTGGRKMSLRILSQVVDNMV